MFNNFYGMPFGGPIHPIFLNSNHHYDHCDHYSHHAHPFGPANSFGPHHSFGPYHSFGQGAPVKCFPNGHFDHFLNPWNMRPSPMHNAGGPFGHHENFKPHNHHGHYEHHKHHGHHKYHKHESSDHKFRKDDHL